MQRPGEESPLGANVAVPRHMDYVPAEAAAGEEDPGASLDTPPDAPERLPAMPRQPAPEALPGKGADGQNCAKSSTR